MISLSFISVLAAGLVACYYIFGAIYNVFFHPLRHYPGPLSAKINMLTWIYHMYQGDFVMYVTDLHEKYGEVVRVAPNELSYINAQAWQDIFGYRTPNGRGDLPKDRRTHRPQPNQTASILSANDQDHRRMRRLQSHMVSEKALNTQEPLIMSYVDKLISRLYEQTSKPETATLDLVRWYNYVTFDILGVLAFGDSFGCLESDELHPWIVNVSHAIKDLNLFRLAKNFPWPVFDLLRALASSLVTAGRLELLAFASRKARERMDQGDTDRVDFMSYILKHNDEKGMTTKEIESNAPILIIAGSETTSTFLAGITYNLLRTPTALKKLTEIIRTAFPNEGDINMASLQSLEYFTACIEEGFRTYPPVPSGLIRETNDQGNIICERYVPPGTAVYVTQWAAYHSRQNFANPETFAPERWLKDAPAIYAGDNRKVLQPFSIGPRNCIGRNLAYAELRLILARMLWNFDFELQPESRDWISKQKIWILWEKAPLRVKLIPRKV